MSHNKQSLPLHPSSLYLCDQVVFSWWVSSAALRTSLAHRLFQTDMTAGWGFVCLFLKIFRKNLRVCSGRREERNWFNRFKVLVLNSYLGKQQIIHKKKRPFMCLSHEKTASLCAYIYSTTGNTRLSKIKMCSKHHLGLQMHEPSNMAAVSLCQFWTIELQLAAWRESVKRPRTSLLTWWMVYSLYVWSFVAIVVLVWGFCEFCLFVCFLLCATQLLQLHF